ncbi:hypothetical protein ST44_07520 [Prevotella pectinovora]|uniref:Uncharacterized protein n=1 Tax=Prevotella pectinovora TaxID=1602169 RepID=A0A0D0IZF3_9BACT|nr:hypothetical protein ST44_07520 [Prevotella pectinovora]
MVVNDANVLADLLLVHPPKGILKTQKNMTLPNALTPSSIIMRKSFRHPRVQSGNVEEESFRI